MFQVILNKLNEIENNTHIKPEIRTLLKLLSNIERQLQKESQKPNETKILESTRKNTTENANKPQRNLEDTVDENIRQSVLNIFGPEPTQQSSTANSKHNAAIQQIQYNDNEAEQLRKPQKYLEETIDENIRQSVLNIFGPNPTQQSSTTTPNPNAVIHFIDNEALGRSLTVFGRRPTSPTTTTVKPTVKVNLKSTEDNLCSLIDIRTGVPTNCEGMITPKKKHKHKKLRRKGRPKLDVRIEEDANAMDEDYYDDYETEANEENMNLTTEATTTHTDAHGDVNAKHNSRESYNET